MDDHECDFPDTCNVCQGRVEQSPPWGVAKKFIARYDGTCVECNLPLDIGKPAVQFNNGSYAHNAASRDCAYDRITRK